MDGQTRLFRLAPEAVTIQAHFVGGEGWELLIRVRRGDETWDDSHQEHYSFLTTTELVDVLTADLAGALGL